MDSNVWLRTADYVVIGVVLLVPVGIGVLFAVRDAKKASREEYLLGGRKMRVLPVAMSLFVTFISAISMMGTPTDLYTFGAMFFAVHFGFMLSYLIGAFTMVPLLFPLRLTSVYEYLRLRFDSELVRMSIVTVGMLQTVCYMAVALLTPALGLQAAAGIPLWMSLAIVGIIGTIYTAIGGIKSVIWADAYQCLLMYTGVILCIIKGTIDVGGGWSAWEIAEKGGRTALTEWSFDPRTRHTWWGTLIGGLFMWLVHFCNQSTVQRICSLQTLRGAKICYLLNIPIFLPWTFLLLACGMVIYAYFAFLRCDPIEAGLFSNRNQLPPFFVLHAFRNYPGVPGLYMGTIFSGALSTISSGINALAANTVEDYLKRHLMKVKETTATFITKIIVCIYGGLVIALAYAANSLDGPITQMGLSVFGACGGPVLGVYILGACVPWANKYGAFFGGFLSLACNIWMALGNQMYGRKPRPLPSAPTDMCFPNDTSSTLWNSVSSATMLNNVTVSPLDSSTTQFITTSTDGKDPYAYSDVFFYDISYEWYGFIGAILSFTLGIIISFFTRKYIKTTTDPRYIVPMLRKFWSLPEPNLNGMDVDTNIRLSLTKLDEYEHQEITVFVNSEKNSKNSPEQVGLTNCEKTTNYSPEEIRLMNGDNEGSSNISTDQVGLMNGAKE